MNVDPPNLNHQLLKRSGHSKTEAVAKPFGLPSGSLAMTWSLRTFLSAKSAVNFNFAAFAESPQPNSE